MESGQPESGGREVVVQGCGLTVAEEILSKIADKRNRTPATASPARLSGIVQGTTAHMNDRNFGFGPTRWLTICMATFHAKLATASGSNSSSGTPAFEARIPMRACPAK